MRGRILLVLALISVAIGTPSTVLAQRVDQPPSTAPPNNWIVVDGWLGAGGNTVVDGTSLATAALGLTGIYHGDWLELGAALTWQPDTSGLGTSNAFGTLLAGFKVDPTPRLRLEVLAEGGVDYVSIGGGASESVDSGGTAALPYAGGRIGVSFPLGRTRRTVIGWWMNGGAAIGSVVVNSIISTCNSAGACSTASQTDTIGGVTWSTGLRFGGEILQW